MFSGCSIICIPGGMTSGRTDKALDYGLKGLRFEPRPGSCDLFLGRDPWWDLVSSTTGLPNLAGRRRSSIEKGTE